MTDPEDRSALPPVAADDDYAGYDCSCGRPSRYRRVSGVDGTSVLFVLCPSCDSAPTDVTASGWGSDFADGQDRDEQ